MRYEVGIAYRVSGLINRLIGQKGDSGVAKKKPQLPRGYWETSVGQTDLERLRRKEVLAEDLALQRRTTQGGVEAALRRDDKKKAGLGPARKAKPGSAVSILSGLSRSVELARAFADESMLMENAELRRQLAESKAELAAKEREFEALETRLNAIQAEARRLESRLTEGRMSKAGVVTGE